MAQPIVEPRWIARVGSAEIAPKISQMHIQSKDVFRRHSVVSPRTAARIVFRLRVDAMADENKALTAPLRIHFRGVVAA